MLGARNMEPELEVTGHFSIEPFVDADRVAEHTSYERRTVLLWARKGLIRAYPPPGDLRQRNDWRFKLSEVDEDLRKQVNSPRRPCPASRRIQ